MKWDRRSGEGGDGTPLQSNASAREQRNRSYGDAYWTERQSREKEERERRTQKLRAAWPHGRVARQARHQVCLTFLVHSAACLSCVFLSFLSSCAISGTSGSSGLGSVKREQMDRRTCGDTSNGEDAVSESSGGNGVSSISRQLDEADATFISVCPPSRCIRGLRTQTRGESEAALVCVGRTLEMVRAGDQASLRMSRQMPP